MNSITNDMQAMIDVLNPGAVVYVAGSCGEPKGLLTQISATPALKQLHYIQFPLGAINQFDLSSLTAESTQETFFMSPFLQDGLKAGRVAFVPMHMRAVFDYLGRRPIDVALLQAARDVDGELRFGPNVDFVESILANAKHVVIEESTQWLAPKGTPLVDQSRVHAVIPIASEKPVFPSGPTDPVSTKIGKQIAALIRDGDCLQTGIGAVPAAILENLQARNDLGFHGGLMDDGVMQLIRDGNLNGRAKQIDKGKHILGMALGSEAMLDWLAQDEAAENVVFRSANHTHDANVISQLDNFVSINSAVEIDLMGQVNAEVAGSKQISGTGGSVDFMRAAKMSRGGRSIVAMTATARNGSVSRIVPSVKVVTALRTDVDLVVTEFGVAELKDESLASRAQRLIDIAHPDFRDELRAAMAN